jgi:diacylglycerol kinase (ATP)
MPYKKGTHSVRESFNFAIEGVLEAIKTERHMKFHVLATFIVIILSILYGVTQSEVAILSITISLVWIAELVNTAIENSIDIVCKAYNPLAKKAKDMAAGAVFIATINSLIVGYTVFHNKIDIVFKDTFESLKGSYNHIFVIILFIVVVVVIWIKSYFNKGTPLRGGMPSGHSALAASICMSVFFITDNIKIFYLTLFLMLLVMQSRIEGKTHSIAEIIYGALLGGGLTYFVLIALEM